MNFRTGDQRNGRPNAKIDSNMSSFESKVFKCSRASLKGTEKKTDSPKISF